MSFAYNRKAPAFEESANKSCLRCNAFTSRRKPHAARTPSATSLSAQEHARYVMEMGVTRNADYLSSLLQVLIAQGQQQVSPSERHGLHPLVVPLSSGPVAREDDDAAIMGDEAVTGLLRWPTLSSAEGMSVVRMSRGAPAVTLLARSPKEFLTRALAEEDYSSRESSQIADSMGDEAQQLYTRGSAESSSLPSLNAWLTKEGCMFPDVLEALVSGHLSRDDQMSAMIASEWYMKRAHFPGWARPYEFNAQLYQKLGRVEEARDSARVALYTPWWTLRSGFKACAELARFPGSGAEVRQILSDVMKSSEGGALPPGISVATKTDAQLAVEEAEHLMNTVAAGEASWDSIRSDLAAKYEEGEQKIIADFIRAAS